MAQELSTAAAERLVVALSRFREWRLDLSEPPVLVRRLGGKTNDNYVVASGDRRLVVRLNNPLPDPGIDRSIERRILMDIRSRAFAPVVRYIDDGCLVTEFVDAAHPARPFEPPMLEKLGGLYRDIHRTPTSVSEHLDPWRHARHYRDVLQHAGRELDAPLRQVVDDIIGGEHLEETSASPCLCHHDLLGENILIADGRATVIDWEYARLGDPAFDISVFAETYDLDHAQLEALLSGYGDPELEPSVERYRALYSLIELLWGMCRDMQSPESIRHFVARHEDRF